MQRAYCMWYGKYMEDIAEHEMDQCVENEQDCERCGNMVSKDPKRGTVENWSISGVANKVVPSLTMVDLSDMAAPMVVIYENPADFPSKCIARVWEAALNSPTNTIIVRDTVQECRDDLMAAGFLVCVKRNENDAKCIVESWMR